MVQMKEGAYGNRIRVPRVPNQDCWLTAIADVLAVITRMDRSGGTNVLAGLRKHRLLSLERWLPLCECSLLLLECSLSSLGCSPFTRCEVGDGAEARGNGQ